MDSAARKIQRSWHRFQKVENRNDIFTLEPFPEEEEKEKLFRVYDRRHVFQFQHRSLMEYILNRGCTENPLTRKAFRKETLRRLANEYFKLPDSSPIPFGEGEIFTEGMDLIQTVEKIISTAASHEQKTVDIQAATEEFLRSEFQHSLDSLAVVFHAVTDEETVSMLYLIKDSHEIVNRLIQRFFTIRSATNNVDFVKSLIAKALDVFADIAFENSGNSYRLTSLATKIYSFFVGQTFIQPLHPKRDQYIELVERLKSVADVMDI